jgi:hypothetical protein
MGITADAGSDASGSEDADAGDSGGSAEDAHDGAMDAAMEDGAHPDGAIEHDAQSE